MAKRKAISNAKRFRVLYRDNFRCQYCGATANEARLEVDHITPLAKGGSNDESNLITACSICNNGKSANELSKQEFEGIYLKRLQREILAYMDDYIDAQYLFTPLNDMYREYGYEAVVNAINEALDGRQLESLMGVAKAIVDIRAKLLGVE